jgi:hypothetical protein
LTFCKLFEFSLKCFCGSLALIAYLADSFQQGAKIASARGASGCVFDVIVEAAFESFL